MPQYAVTYEYTPDAAATRTELLQEHRAWLSPLLERGVLGAAGVFPDGSGSLLVITADDESALVEILDADPFHAADAVPGRSWKEWRVNWGPLAPVAESA